MMMIMVFPSFTPPENMESETLTPLTPKHYTLQVPASPHPPTSPRDSFGCPEAGARSEPASPGLRRAPASLHSGKAKATREVCTQMQLHEYLVCIRTNIPGAKSKSYLFINKTIRSYSET